MIGRASRVINVIFAGYVGAGPGIRSRMPGPGEGPYRKESAMKIEANGIRINYRIDGPEGAAWVSITSARSSGPPR